MLELHGNQKHRLIHLCRYDVTIQGEDIVSMDSLGPPALVAVANNTAVNRTLDLTANAYDSTLGE